MTWIEFLLTKKIQMLTIHGRTKAQMSKVPADWEAIGRVRELRDQLSPDTLIVGNGDVMNRQQGLDLAEQYTLDGVMIGRGIFQDPFAFAAQSPWPEVTAKDKRMLYKKHVERFAETWRHGERPIQTLNKFCKIYINGFDGAKELREQLMSATSSDELMSILDAAN